MTSSSARGASAALIAAAATVLVLTLVAQVGLVASVRECHELAKYDPIDCVPAIDRARLAGDISLTAGLFLVLAVATLHRMRRPATA